MQRYKSTAVFEVKNLLLQFVRNRRQFTIFFLLLIGLFYVSYSISIPFAINTVYLTVATFLFAIFASFFTSRQSARHEDMRARVAQFDGNLASIYRSSGVIDEDLQEKVGIVIKAHYTEILKNRSWNYHLKNSSSTIRSIHGLLKESLAGKNLDSLGTTTLMQIEWSLRDLQRVRKDQITLYTEQVPILQWTLLALLASLLVITIMSIQSYEMLIPSLLKSSFIVSILLVLSLISGLNTNSLFEELFGEDSARDILKSIN